MKLQSMTDFVLEQNDIQEEGIGQAYNKIVAYAEFLKQPLTLGMFVPCDGKGNVLGEPHLGMFHDNRAPLRDLEFAKIEYEKAKEKVLFKTEFKMDEEKAKYFISTFETIDNLAQLYDLELTESALKQIGIK